MDNVFETPLFRAIEAQADEWRSRSSTNSLQKRMYSAARPSRLALGFGGSTSANAELHASLRSLRDRSRTLIRDSAYAKRAKRVVVENVVGTGIGVQPIVRSTRGELRKPLNQAIYDAWWDWCRAEWCHTGGQMHFSDIERQVMGQVFEAGEIFIRLHPREFGDSPVPLSLEVIEPERIADEYAQPGAYATGARVIQGVEVDDYYRPVAYWIRTIHPGEHLFAKGQADRVERVPADQIIHLRLIDRWPQVRGEPWMHAVIRKLADIDGYTEAEIIAARAASMYFGTIETPTDSMSIGEQQEDGTYHLPLEPGMMERLSPGEKLNFVNPNRPNSALDPFLRYMLREMAAGVGTSYESLSRDYSQSNYSSSRLSLLEDRDAWRAIQQWLVRNFREPLHRVWLRQAALAQAVPGLTVIEYALSPSKFAAAEFKPRGWSWVDPTKEVAAYKEAVKAGVTTLTTVIAQTDPQGRDASEVFEERKRELEELEAMGLEFDTSPDAYAKTEPVVSPPVGAAPESKPDDQDAEDMARPARVLTLKR